MTRLGLLDKTSLCTPLPYQDHEASQSRRNRIHADQLMSLSPSLSRRTFVKCLISQIKTKMKEKEEREKRRKLGYLLIRQLYFPEVELGTIPDIELIMSLSPLVILLQLSPQIFSSVPLPPVVVVRLRIVQI